MTKIKRTKLPASLTVAADVYLAERLKLKSFRRDANHKKFFADYQKARAEFEKVRVTEKKQPVPPAGKKR